MKKLLVLALALIMVLMSFGCSKSDNNSSSSLEEAKDYSNPLGLTTSSSSSATSSKKEESEKSNSVKSNSSSKKSSSSSSSSSSVSSTTSSDAGIVPPSTIPNPTGLTSQGRKNNNGKNWELTLVNPWNTLHRDYSVNVSLIDSRFASGLYFDSRAVKYLNNMCSAASKDGVSLYVISAYRTFDYQQGLFNQEVNEYFSYHPNASREEAEKGAATEVARPGTSEHNLGLAVDFNSVEQSFENTAQFKWLQKHCTEYGFILRYSPTTQSKTAVIYEPWHYRYVGVENAKKIAKSGLTLEEYLAR